MLDDINDFNLLSTRIAETDRVDDDLIAAIMKAPECFEENQLFEIYKVFIAKFPIYLYLIPEQMRTYDMCMYAVSLDNCLDIVPQSLRDKRLCVAALKKSLIAIAHVPIELLDEDEFKNAVKFWYDTINNGNFGFALQWLPVSKRDLQICITAVNQDPSVVEHVPNHLLDNENFNDAIALFRSNLIENPLNINIKRLPKKILTEDICIAGIKKDKKSFFDIPKEFRTLSIYTAMIELVSFHDNLNFIETILNEDYQEKTVLTADEYRKFIVAVLKKDFALYKNCPEKYIDFSLCNQLVVAANPGNVDYLADELAFINAIDTFLNITEYRAICLAAVKRNGHALRHIKANVCNYDLCLAAITQNSLAIQYVSAPISDEERNWQIQHHLLSHSDLTFDEYKKLCLIAIKKEARAFDLINKKRFDCEIYLELVKCNSDVLAKIHYKKANLTEEQFKKICLAAVKKEGGHILSSVPAKIRDFNICFAAAKRGAEIALELIKNPGERNLTIDEYKKVCLTAIKNGSNIEKIYSLIPKDILDFEMCLEIAKRNGLLLAKIKNDVAATAIILTPNEYKKVCWAAVSQNGIALQHVPHEMLDLELYFESTKTNGLALEYIKNDEQTNLTEEQYREICLAAVKQDGSALKFVPQEMRDYEIYLESVKSNSHALAYIKEDFKINLTEEQYSEICLIAVNNCPIALQFVDDAFKSMVIDKVTPEYLLSYDYGLIVSFPNDYLFNEKFKNRLADMLSNVANVVVTKVALFSFDKEIKDAYTVYANSTMRKNKTLHVNSNNLERLLSDISIQDITGKPLNLVLLGHAVVGADDMAVLKPSEITRLLINHESIKRVTLLGCKTAKAKPLMQEQKMIQTYQRQESQQHLSHAGLIIMAEYPDPKCYSDYLSKICNKSKHKQEPSLDWLFIIVNNLRDNEPCLLEIRRNGNAWTTKTYALDNPEKRQNIGKFLGRANQKIPPVNQKNSPLYYRDGKSKPLMTAKESAALIDIANGASKFSKKHPEYEQDKSQYPFLANIKIDKAEEDKLLPSLLKSVTDAIKAEPKIKQDIDVKGYTKSVHVDIPERQMKMTHTYLYTQEYKSNNKHNFFTENKDNLNRKKLEQERNDEVQAMANGIIGDNSMAKSITVHIAKM